jgi:hypothetical protein
MNVMSYVYLGGLHWNAARKVPEIVKRVKKIRRAIVVY